MITLDVVPHVGIGPARLGLARLANRSCLDAIGLPLEETRKALDYFAENALQIEYDDDGKAQFIGIGSSGALRVLFFGLDVFDTPARDVFAAIARREATGAHAFDSSEYLFPEQVVTLWEADEQYDHRGGQRRVVWAQIGIGNARYLDAIRQISAG